MLLNRDDLLAFEEPAFLGEHLVFDMDGGHACGLVLLHRAHHVQRIAVT